jgi:hypothetical protein
MRSWRLGLLLVVMSGSACEPLSPGEHVTVLRWLECEECDRGQLDSVVALGGSAVPALTAYLWKGPPKARVSRLTAHLVKSHAQVNTYSAALSPTDSLSEATLFVRRYVRNYTATYQSRAARALGLIGGLRARAALEISLLGSLRSDVQAQVHLARDSLWTP